MPFDVVAWIFGWAMGRAGDSIVKTLTPTDLTRRLSATIRDWAASLPPERHLVPEAIFTRSEPEPGPARRLLFQRLIDSKPPTEVEWHGALIERWHSVRESGADLQPFFLLSESEASADLKRLAGRLCAVCLGDERMYRAATAGLGARIDEWQHQGPILLVNHIEEPARWNSIYDVRFHLHNSTQSPLLISALRILVEDLAKIEHRRTTSAGAKVHEHEFGAHLSPCLGPVKLSARGASRFSLDPGDTEFFRVRVEAQTGWAYCVRLAATVTGLRDGRSADVQTGSHWLSFEETT